MSTIYTAPPHPSPSSIVMKEFQDSSSGRLISAALLQIQPADFYADGNRVNLISRAYNTK